MQAVATDESSNSKRIHSLTASNGFESLSDDLIIEILSWLPVKCLTRYKCVCKLWLMIIKSRNFIEKHYQQAKSYRVDLKLYSYPFQVIYRIDGLSLQRHTIHGYYCIKNDASNRPFKLPERKGKISHTGMSYLPSREKYMVLSFQWQWAVDYAYMCLKVLTIGVDVTWRSIDVPISYCGNKSEVVKYRTHNGISYIVKYCNISCCQPQIIAFQTEDESFVEIPLPPRVEGIYYIRSRFRFITWDDKLCLLWKVEGGLHIWVLQDYKKGEWEERKIVFPSGVIKEHPYIKNLNTYKISEDVVYMHILGGSSQLCYHIKTKRMLGVSNLFIMVKYSLVSLF